MKFGTCPVALPMLSAQSFLIPPEDRENLRKQVLAWGNSHPHFVFLENAGEPFAPSWVAEGWLAGVGAHQILKDEGHFFEQLAAVKFENPLLGYLGYDLKNQVEKLSSSNFDGIKAPDGQLIEPVHFLRFDGKELRIHTYKGCQTVWESIQNTSLKQEDEVLPSITLKARIAKQEYLDKVKQVIDYIIDGEVYELNLCMEYFAEAVHIDPLDLYKKLIRQTSMPFASYLKMDSCHVLCASPERFLKKQGRKLLSQPIKGTRKRGADASEDEQLKMELLHSEKDRAENVMIVDLVRNDLARVCDYGSVEVEELFGIYSFSNVHQMISTISGNLREGIHFAEALRSTFPMGSMTGAPKIRAMQLIEELETSKRGIYSGSIGIIYPDGDFDLNVVIRTLLYNEKDSYLSVQAGGAITYDSKPEEEWEEIQIKLSTIYKLFTATFFHKS
ncbi:MAG: aminodeoxychorismate synthase component I [Bacteroidia bacterium]